ncbi:3-keto-5-aminohexanoate cleavage protein [Fusibacter paucivorans]|uniref:3-keto-5-aminohexanoate cleavage protein n=1 Tax=Fusibacter paucivorans TaxID=76009 RepID=A0ABS5PJR6_9FIRM|nr:3-keto-5-aminohexanoate cleavage protein [Fusibacter paucivorans]
MKDKVFITAALTGAVTPKDINPNIPLTPEEIAVDAYNCWKAGAAMVHLHMRDEDGRGTMDSKRFRKAVELIRGYKDCDVIICCTSSGTYPPVSDEERMRHFTEIPEIEMGSYDAGTFNWGCDVVFDNTPKFLESLGKCYMANDVKPELEIFDLGMMGNVKHYMKKGVLPPNPYYQFVLGVLGGMESSVANMKTLVDNLPEGAKWSAFGIGRNHMPMMFAALALGADGIRVGLEDNVMYAKDVPATNVMLVERAARVINEYGKKVATAAEAREILSLPPLKRL